MLWNIVFCFDNASEASFMGRMRVCRVCLKQSIKVYDLDYGTPSVRAKLLSSVPNFNTAFFNNQYCVCETCYKALNFAYQLREATASAEADVKAAMAKPDDYANVNKAILEASRRREKLGCEARSMLLSDIKEEEQLAAIATIAPEAGEAPSGTLVSSPGPEPLLITLKPDAINSSLSTVNVSGIELAIPVSKMVDVSEYAVAGPPGVGGVQKVVPLGRMCHICFRQYPNRSCLLSHVRAMHHTHGKTKVIKSSALNKRLHMSLLSPDEMCAIHMEAAKKCEPTECADCRITLKCAHEMRYHVTAIHKGYKIREINFPVKCNACAATVGHKFLKLHMKEHAVDVLQEASFGPAEGGEEIKDESNEKEIEKPEDDLERPTMEFWQCDICKVMFKYNRETINAHLKIHRELKDM